MAETVDVTPHEEKASQSSESWRDDEESEAIDVVSTVISSPAEMPCVTPHRKNELLLQARADRLAWIQSIPLPYATNADTPRDPWTQDDRLASLQTSHAVHRLPSVTGVLSDLYGIDETNASVTETAERVQAMLESLGMTPEERNLSIPTGNQTLEVALSNANRSEDRVVLESYRSFLTKLQSPDCAMVVQGMRTFVRTIPSTTADAAALSLRSYLQSTLDVLKSHSVFHSVDDDLRHSLESFLFGHCYGKISALLNFDTQEDEECSDRLNSLQFLTPAHLEISCFGDDDVGILMQKPIAALLSVDSCFSPYEKLQRILHAYHAVNEALSAALNRGNEGTKILPSADDILPSLILTVLRAKPPRLVSNLRMIEVFSPPEYLRGEAGYAYTNLYGAVQFLRDLQLDGDPETLSISPDDFRNGLEKCRIATKAQLQQATTIEDNTKVEEERAPSFLLDIPVSTIRAARLRGETVDVEWALRWQADQGASHLLPPSGQSTGQESLDSSYWPDSLPAGFSRTYSFLDTRPDEVRMADLPLLLAEYRMLVHTTEQLLAERTSRIASERKKKVTRTRQALLARAAETDPTLVRGSKSKKSEN